MFDRTVLNLDKNNFDVGVKLDYFGNDPTTFYANFDQYFRIKIFKFIIDVNPVTYEDNSYVEELLLEKCQ